MAGLKKEESLHHQNEWMMWGLKRAYIYSCGQILFKNMFILCPTTLTNEIVKSIILVN